MSNNTPYESIQNAKRKFINSNFIIYQFLYLERLQESVSQMIKERLDHSSKGALKQIHLQTYGKHKHHVGMVKWSQDKIPTMHDIIKKQALSTPSPNKYSGHIKLQVPRFYGGFSKVKK